MADRYWIASAPGAWNDTANWSDTSGGSGGASVPTGSGDTANFDSNGTGSCTLSSRDIDCPVVITNDITFTGSNDHRDAISFDISNNSTLTLSSLAADFRTDGATWNVASGSTLYSPSYPIRTRSGAINCLGTWSADTTYYARSPGVCLDIQTAMTFGGSLEKEVTTFTNEGSIRFPSGTTTINGDFEVDGYSIDITCDLNTNDGNLTINGNLTVGTYGAWSKGNGTITLSGTAAQSIDFAGAAVEDIVVSNTSDTVTFSGNVTTDSYTQNAGSTVTGTGFLQSTGNFEILGTSGSPCSFSVALVGTTGSVRTATYTTISNSDARGGPNNFDYLDYPISCYNYTDGGGTRNWLWIDPAISIVDYPSYVGTYSQNDAFGQAITCPYPANIQAGETLAVIASSNDNGAWTMNTAGFTEYFNSPFNEGLATGQAGFWLKHATDGTETGDVSLSQAAGADANLNVVIIRIQDTDTVVPLSNAGKYENASTDVNLLCPSITPAHEKTWGMCLGFTDSVSAVTATPPPGVNVIVQVDRSNRAGILLGWFNHPTISPTGDNIWTLAGADQYAGVHVAFKGVTGQAPEPGVAPNALFFGQDF